jgi:hypothetical protein
MRRPRGHVASEGAAEGSERTAHAEPSADAAATDVASLLVAYRDARALARRPPASISLPRQPHVLAIARWIHMHVRPTWGAERWVDRHIRRRVEVLQRSFAERLAFDPGVDDVRNRDALQHFHEALRPPLSRLAVVGGFVASVALRKRSARAWRATCSPSLMQRS